MTVEYVLVLSAFVIFLLQSLMGPQLAFSNMGPKLGARVEKQLMTGDQFSEGRARHRWQP